MVTARQIAIVGFTLLAASTPAHAHGTEYIIRPLVLIAVLCGGISGIATASLRRSEGLGLGIAFGILSAIALVFLVYSSLTEHFSVGLFLGGLLMAAIVVSFGGAIPLAIAFLVSYRLTAYIRKRVRDDAKRESTAP